MLTMWGNSKKGMILLFFLVSGIFFGLINSLLFSNVKGLITDQLGQSAIQVASTAAKIIEEDISPYQKLVDSARNGTSYDEVYYGRMLLLFQRIKEDTRCTYVYTEIQHSDNEIMYILDGENPESEMFSPLGSLDELEIQEEQSYLEKIAIATGIVSWANWGELVSGYAPIIHQNTGELVGLVGVDYSIDHIRGLLQNILGLMIFFGVALSVLSTWLFYKLYRDRFQALNVDYLTGLYSRRFLDYRLEKEIKRAEKGETSLCLMMADIDDFKKINDLYGHEVGDQVLRHTALRLQKIVGGKGYPYRLGGDEFLALIIGSDQKEGYRLACTMSDSYGWEDEDLQGFLPAGLEVTLSLGVAFWEEGMQGRELIEKADRALYVAKESGKNQVCVFEG